MKNYSISVIIPCYNSEKYIKKTLSSVLSQSYRPDEILVVDDGSEDETRNILESYFSQIKILCHPNNSNLGTAASMNLGIKHTKSELIAFLDHDDLWYPTKLSEQVKIFEKYPDVGLVYTNVFVIDENDNDLFKIYPDDFKELNKPDQLLSKCYIRTASSVMVRRSLFEKIGFFKTQIRAADHDMWIRMIEKTKFFYLPKCLASHRKHPTQISSGRKIWEDGFVILREACKRYPYGTSVKRKRLAVLHYRLGEYDWSHKLYWKATKYFLLAAMFDPLRGIKICLSSLFDVSKQN
jgi:glycosyltransferase involved in cell wall biosynthesis